MKLLWFTWKDRRNPQGGGAEVVNEELAKRLVADGHQVKFIVAGFRDGAAQEERDGFEIIRVGDRWSVYWRAFIYYRKHLSDWPDKVIDEINAMPFFCRFFVRQPNGIFIHQLTRMNWFYQMFFPLNIIGFLAEPIYLWLLSGRTAITVSSSTKAGLVRYGFRKERVEVMRLGLNVAPVADLAAAVKDPDPTMLALGCVRPMKRTDHVVRAFELAKREMPELKLIVAGDMSWDYGKEVCRMVAASPHVSSITCHDRVSEKEKLELMRRAHVLCAASVQEGWGLVVPEANSQGTPAVAYDIDGLRDSVQHGETGLITASNDPAGLARAVVELLRDRETYGRLRRRAWEWSKTLNYDETYGTFSRWLAEL